MLVASPVSAALKACVALFAITVCAGVLLGEVRLGLVPQRNEAEPGEPLGLTEPFSVVELLVVPSTGSEVTVVFEVAKLIIWL